MAQFLRSSLLTLTDKKWPDLLVFVEENVSSKKYETFYHLNWIVKFWNNWHRIGMKSIWPQHQITYDQWTTVKGNMYDSKSSIGPANLLHVKRCDYQWHPTISTKTKLSWRWRFYAWQPAPVTSFWEKPVEEETNVKGKKAM